MVIWHLIAIIYYILLSADESSLLNIHFEFIPRVIANQNVGKNLWKKCNSKYIYPLPLVSSITGVIWCPALGIKYLGHSFLNKFINQLFNKIYSKDMNYQKLF